MFQVPSQRRSPHPLLRNICSFKTPCETTTSTTSAATHLQPWRAHLEWQIEDHDSRAAETTSTARPHPPHTKTTVTRMKQHAMSRLCTAAAPSSTARSKMKRRRHNAPACTCPQRTTISNATIFSAYKAQLCTGKMFRRSKHSKPRRETPPTAHSGQFPPAI